ncbi:MAG: hypothetical protein ACM3JP_02745 [Betaproteobacteria bacterium]
MSTSASTVDPGWTRFDRWSSNLFLLGAVLALLVLLTLLGLLGSNGLPGIVITLTLAVGLANAAVLVRTSVALDRATGWARPAAVAILWILVVMGLVGAVVDLAKATIPIPILPIIALLVLGSRPGPLPRVVDRDSRTAAAIGVVFLATTVGAGAPSWLATSSDSPLTVSRDALQLDLAVTCDGNARAMPGRVEVVASWTWSARDLMPMGEDVVGVGWWAEDGDGTPIQLDMADAGASDAGYVTSGSAGPAGSVVGTRLSGMQTWEWVVMTAAGGLRDGWARITLEPALAGPGERPAHGRLSLSAVYAHLDRWSATQGTACSW